MRFLKPVRYLTYAVLVAIAVVVTRQRYFVEAQLEPVYFKPAPSSTAWVGQSEQWLRDTLSTSRLITDVLLESSSLEIDPKIRADLLKARPGYSDFLRHMIWVRDLGGWKIRQHEIYLFKDGKGWLILEVSEKDEQMTG
jgi:hypothetical protein